jgi:DNA-binding GntR family transcriptional regulator
VGQKKSIEEIYTSLFNKIIKNQYPPDSWLKEDKIAEEYGVSRTPVREVFRILEQDGLVQLIPNRGVRVFGFTIDDLEDIFEIRRVLECLALEYAVPGLSIHGLKEIRDRIEEARKTDSSHETARLDFELHHYFIDSCGRRRLISMLNQLTHLLQTFREMSFADREIRESTYKEHITLINAISIRDIEGAKKILEEHIRNSKIRILRTVFNTNNHAHG